MSELQLPVTVPATHPSPEPEAPGAHLSRTKPMWGHGASWRVLQNPPQAGPGRLAPIAPSGHPRLGYGRKVHQKQHQGPCCLSESQGPHSGVTVTVPGASGQHHTSHGAVVLAMTRRHDSELSPSKTPSATPSQQPLKPGPASMTETVTISKLRTSNLGGLRSSTKL